MKELLERKDIQFVAWIVSMVLAVAIPFVTYGERINRLESDVAENKIIAKEVSTTLVDIQLRVASIQKDIEFIKVK